MNQNVINVNRICQMHTDISSYHTLKRMQFPQHQWSTYFQCMAKVCKLECSHSHWKEHRKCYLSLTVEPLVASEVCESLRNLTLIIWDPIWNGFSATHQSLLQCFWPFQRLKHIPVNTMDMLVKLITVTSAIGGGGVSPLGVCVLDRKSSFISLRLFSLARTLRT